MKKMHNWITLENPRNGKVQVRACSDCGTMKLSPSQAVSECKVRTLPSRSFSGWKQVSLEA